MPDTEAGNIENSEAVAIGGATIATAKVILQQSGDPLAVILANGLEVKGHTENMRARLQEIIEIIKGNKNSPGLIVRMERLERYAPWIMIGVAIAVIMGLLSLIALALHVGAIP